METVFATHHGCVRNTAKPTRGGPVQTSVAHSDTTSHHHTTETTSGLGGQLGELAAALNTIGWNHNQVPPEERAPASEAPYMPHGSGDAAHSGLGGQIAELVAALNTVGWNRNQVLPEDRLPLQERT